MITYLPQTSQIHEEAVRQNFEYIESHAVFKTQPYSLTYSRATETAADTQLRAALVASGLVVDNTVP